MSTRGAGRADSDHVEDVVAEATRRTGIDFSGSRGSWLRSVVQRAVGASGDQDVDPLRDDELFRRFCDEVTVQESFFFREPARLDLVARVVLPGLATRPGPVSVWSAGCAAGQEAYTVAALLREAGLAGRYRVLGTDLSPAAVAEAREGVYTRWSLRGVDDALVARYFTVARSGFRVRDELREGVSFEQRNLLDEPPVPPGGFDLVLCRNVLIYLTPEATRHAVRNIASSLAPDGWLVTSASDPLLDDVDGITAAVTEQGLAYRRADAPAPSPKPSPHVRPRDRRVPAPERRRPARARTVAPAESPAAEPMLGQGERALHLADHGAAEAAARRVLAGGGDENPAAAHCVLVQALAGSGQTDAARQAADAAVAAFPLEAPLRHLQAVVLLDSGLPAEAAAAARNALYLDPDLAAAHFVLARSQELLGNLPAADRSRRTALRLVAEAAP